MRGLMEQQILKQSNIAALFSNVETLLGVNEVWLKKKKKKSIHILITFFFFRLVFPRRN